MSAENERFASLEDLRSLFNETHGWLAEHGNPVAARGVVGYAPDGLIIANDLASFNASLPVGKLRQIAPDHMKTLGIARRLHLVSILPGYVNDNPPDLESPTECLMITSRHGRHSPFSETTYCLDPALPTGGTLDRITKRTEDENADLAVYLKRLVSAAAAPALEARFGTNRITFDQYTALHAIMSVWSERCLELSPGRTRRYRWK